MGDRVVEITVVMYDCDCDCSSDLTLKRDDSTTEHGIATE